MRLDGETPIDFSGLLSFFEDHLNQQVLPFWLQNSIDREHGGINNCIQDDGTVVSTDKFLWSQGRALWLFSVLYRKHDGDPKWLELAHPIARMLCRSGRNEAGDWYFSLHADGTPAMAPQSLYVDGFCIYGLAEYARATGDKEALQVALEAFEHASPKLEDHSSFPTLPHPIPEGFQAHGPLMLFALVFHDLGVTSGNEHVLNRALELAERVMTEHLRPERQILFEFVRPGGQLDESDVGQTFIPGHVIESMWFMERIYRHHGRRDRVQLAMEAIRWHLEQGWDSEFGGLPLACHASGGPPAWHSPEAKIWWPHTESLQALLLAYFVTREPWALEWYRKVHQYAFTHFPNREHGEWFHNLDRTGKPMSPYLKTLPVKDPFHLPRALVYSIQILRQLADASNEETPV